MGCCSSTPKPAGRTKFRPTHTSDEQQQNAALLSPRPRSPTLSGDNNGEVLLADICSPLGSTAHNGFGSRMEAKDRIAKTLVHHQNSHTHHHPPKDWREWVPEFAKRYELKYEIGRGAYGSVWKAGCGSTSHGPWYAAKIVHRKESGEQGWQMALNEMAVLETLDHPNIVGHRESFTTDQHLVIVMDLCRGGELLCSVNEHVQIYSEEVVCRVVVNVLAGVKHMHKKGVCHRDLKPANLLLKKRLRKDTAHQMEHFHKELDDKHAEHQKAQFAVDDHHHGHHPHKQCKPAFRKIGAQATRSMDSEAMATYFSVHNKSQTQSLSNVLSLTEQELALYTGHDDVIQELSSQVAICDLGMSITFTPGEQFSSVEGLVGTPLYCSPELLTMMLGEKASGVMLEVKRMLREMDYPIEEDPHYDERCDIWSIGIITFTLLAGFHPFMPEQDISMGKVLVDIITKEVDFPAVPWASITKQAMDFVKACLTKDFRKRPMAEELVHHEWFALLEKDVGALKKNLGHVTSQSFINFNETIATAVYPPLVCQIRLVAKGEEVGITWDAFERVVRVEPGSIADRAGVVEGMELTQVNGTPLQATSAERTQEVVNTAASMEGGAVLEFTAASLTGLKSGMRTILESDGVDTLHPADSANPGLALIREVRQERDREKWSRSMLLDRFQSRWHQDVVATLEESLVGCQEKVLETFFVDMQERHPEFGWFMVHSAAPDLREYTDGLKDYNSVHLRFTLGGRGFLVFGARMRAACRADAGVAYNLLTGGEQGGFRIVGTNLPDITIQELYCSLSTEAKIKHQWLVKFFHEHNPRYTWCIVLGTDDTISLHSTYQDKQTLLFCNFIYHHTSAH
eukprot:Sspe_Gene.57982::Locus_31800_Transcript_1_1_Confidence_1.000_Length_2694::g.57982::m.57982